MNNSGAATSRKGYKGTQQGRNRDAKGDNGAAAGPLLMIVISLQR